MSTTARPGPAAIGPGSGHTVQNTAPGRPLPGRPGADRPVRVLIADDSVVMRRLLNRMLATDTAIEIVGSAVDGEDAVRKVGEHLPDLVTLDVEMPKMDGIGALRLIQAQFPWVRVVMCSSLTQRGASVTIDALLAGASDYVCKQHSAGMSDLAFETLQTELLSKIRHLFGVGRTPDAQPLRIPVGPAASAPTPAAPLLREGRAGKPKAIVIGVSTGGPNALADLLAMLPADFALPIAIVQHMPPYFTKLLADRLTRLSPVPVVEGEDGMVLAPGAAIIAPGDYHMRLVRKLDRVVIELNQGEPENSCRPAVDVLFRSAAEVFGGGVIAMVLTGMGQDGLEGVRPLKALGAPILVQDSATSVVWGMPGAIASANLADAVLPLKEIIPEALRRL